ncbi:MAG: hypothetical protein ACKOAP_02675 [Vulcanococcus sp.]
MLHFWAPHLDPAHPDDCTQPERYAIRLVERGTFLAVASDGLGLAEVNSWREAHLFHAHEAAIRAARELNHEGRGPVDVVKVELDLDARGSAGA